MSITTTPDFRDMNKVIESFKKKKAISTHGTPGQAQQLAISPGGGIHSAHESQGLEPQRAQSDTEKEQVSRESARTGANGNRVIG